MTVNQVSVFLEDEPGHLEKVLHVLAEAGINVISLTIAEASGYGLLRMIVDEPDDAVKALHASNITCLETAVLAVEIQDVPGALLSALQGFEQRELNIEYLYTFPERKQPDRIVVIFRFEEADAAEKLLREDGYRILSHQDITGA